MNISFEYQSDVLYTVEHKLICYIIFFTFFMRKNKFVNIS